MLTWAVFGTLMAFCEHFGRVEVDDDSSFFAAGLRVGTYGDECGELFFEKSTGVDPKLGRDSPLSTALVVCPKHGCIGSIMSLFGVGGAK